MQALARELPDAKETYQRLKPQKLENKLVEVHALAAKADQFRNRYESALASDDKDRDHIRAEGRWPGHHSNRDCAPFIAASCDERVLSSSAASTDE